jgi:hypothetical protein
MADSHATVRYTDALRAAAEGLRDLDETEAVGSDDPLTVVTNLHATLDAIRDAWPAIAKSAGFGGTDLHPDEAAHVTGFTKRIETGLDQAVSGMWDATSAI